MNEREVWWSGEFGDSYTERMRGKPGLLACNIALFSKVLSRTEGVRSVLEFGANVGLNLRAFRVLLPGVFLTGVEINKKAREELVLVADSVSRKSILADHDWGKADFVLSKGLLIHIGPDDLPTAYERLWRTSSRYICLVEYYNPTPVELEYRGHRGKLFKRDFAGEMLDTYPLKLVDYGFVYYRDTFRQGDVHWWLMERADGENIRQD